MRIHPKSIRLQSSLAVVLVLAASASAAWAQVTTYAGAQASKKAVLDEATGSDPNGTSLTGYAATTPPVQPGPAGARSQFLGSIDLEGPTAGFEASSRGMAGPIQFGSNNQATFVGVDSQPVPRVVDGNFVGGGSEPATDFELGRYNMTGFKIGASGGLGPLDPGCQSNCEPDLGKWLEATNSFDITFGTAIQALGFFGTDFTDFGGTVSIALFDGDDNAIGTPQAALTGDGGVNGGLIFFGITSNTPFTRVRFDVIQGSCTAAACPVDVLGFDEFIFGNLKDDSGGGTVPSPGSLALAAGGLLALGAARRRRH